MAPLLLYSTVVMVWGKKGRGKRAMFLLEDGNGSVNGNRPLVRRKSDILVGVLFSAVIAFYVILCLVSAQHSTVTTASGKPAQQDSASVGSAISTGR